MVIVMQNIERVAQIFFRLANFPFDYVVLASMHWIQQLDKKSSPNGFSQGHFIAITRIERTWVRS